MNPPSPSTPVTYEVIIPSDTRGVTGPPDTTTDPIAYVRDYKYAPPLLFRQLPSGPTFRVEPERALVVGELILEGDEWRAYFESEWTKVDSSCYNQPVLQSALDAGMYIRRPDHLVPIPDAPPICSCPSGPVGATQCPIHNPPNAPPISTCEWPGCSAPALCQSGNFGNKLVCRDHFKVANGRMSNEEAVKRANERMAGYSPEKRAELEKQFRAFVDPISSETTNPPVPVEQAGTPSCTERITQYLGAGGLFNPEIMDHDKVRKLLIDCRKELTDAAKCHTSRAQTSPDEVDIEINDTALENKTTPHTDWVRADFARRLLKERDIALDAAAKGTAAREHAGAFEEGVRELQEQNATLAQQLEEAKRGSEALQKLLDNNHAVQSQMQECINTLEKQVSYLTASLARVTAEKDRAVKAESDFRTEVAAEFRKHGLAAGPNAIAAIVRERDAARAEKDQAMQAATYAHEGHRLAIRERDAARAERETRARYFEGYVTTLREIGEKLDIPTTSLPMQMPRFINDAMDAVLSELTTLRQRSADTERDTVSKADVLGACQLLEESAGPFDEACRILRALATTPGGRP